MIKNKMYNYFRKHACPVYREAYLEMIFLFTKAKTEAEKLGILREFAALFVMPGEFWAVFHECGSYHS